LKAPVRSLAPDGRHTTYSFLYENAPPGTLPEIWRAKIDGTGRRLLGAGWDPQWSPDGRSIAFVGTDGLSVMDAETGQVVVRALDHGDFFGSLADFDWSPDSRRLLYHYGYYGSNAIRAVRADGKGQPRELIPASRRFTRQFSPVWSPDGKRIAFLRERWADVPDHLDLSIWTATTRGTRLRRIRSSGPQYYEVTETPMLSWGPRP